MTQYVRIWNGEIIERGLPEPIDDQKKLHGHKPRIVPYEEKRPSGELKEGEILEGPVEVVQAYKIVATWTKRSLSVDELAGTIEWKTRMIKDEAQRRIYEIMPQHKQVNWLALHAELSLKHGSDPSKWPAGEQAKVAAVLPQWDAIKAIRERSNEIEATLAGLKKPADILAFDPSAANWDA